MNTKKMVWLGALLLVLFGGSAAEAAPTIESVMAESSTTHIRTEAIQEAAAEESADSSPPLQLSDLGHKGLVVAGWSWVAIGAALVAGADADEVKPLAGLMAVGLATFVVDVVRQ